MKKIIFLLISILSLKTYSQNLNDRIFPKEGDSIICKITSVETNWIHYDHKGKKDIKNDYIHMDEIKYYLQNGVIKKPYEYTPKEYSEVVIVDSAITKNDLYSSFMDWIAKNYVSANNVIQYQDKEEGKIVIKGLFSVSVKQIGGYDAGGNIYHTISIYVKNGKFKYTIDNIYFDGKSGRADINTVKTPTGMMKKDWANIQEQATKELDKTVLSLKAAAKQTKKNKDW